jgi:hypothetical protein
MIRPSDVQVLRSVLSSTWTQDQEQVTDGSCRLCPPMDAQTPQAGGWHGEQEGALALRGPA